MAITIYGGLVAVVLAHATLGLWLAVPLLGVLSGWQSSLQHECIHGHPTPWRGVNTAIAGIPVGLAFPYSRYRQTHRTHHNNELITDPYLDPESFYISPEEWAGASGLQRWLWSTMRTLTGRLVFGPLYYIGRYLRSELRLKHGMILLRHACLTSAMLLAVRLTGMPLWAYALGAGYLGYMVTLLRSFAEHRYVEDGVRSAVIEASLPMRLLYLNNTYHYTHHEHPDVPWYELPKLHRSGSFATEAAAGAGRYRGYLGVARQYAFRPFEHPLRADLTRPKP